MARSLNKVMLIGNLGSDPEVRQTPGGLPVATFSLATNWARKNEAGQMEEKTDWHNIVAWRRLAEICQQYLTKGSKVYIEGRIQTRSWDDKNTGQKRYMTEIVADQMIMLDGPAGSRGEPARARRTEPAAAEPEHELDGDYADDDLPF